MTFLLLLTRLSSSPAKEEEEEEGGIPLSLPFRIIYVSVSPQACLSVLCCCFYPPRQAFTSFYTSSLLFASLCVFLHSQTQLSILKAFFYALNLTSHSFIPFYISSFLINYSCLFLYPQMTVINPCSASICLRQGRPSPTTAMELADGQG